MLQITWNNLNQCKKMFNILSNLYHVLIPKANLLRDSDKSGSSYRSSHEMSGRMLVHFYSVILKFGWGHFHQYISTLHHPVLFSMLQWKCRLKCMTAAGKERVLIFKKVGCFRSWISLTRKAFGFSTNLPDFPHCSAPHEQKCLLP